MILEKTNVQIICQLIADYLKDSIPELPDYYYMVGNFENNGLIITPKPYANVKYFSYNNHYYSLELRLYMSKNQHQIQITSMNKIIEALSSKAFLDYFYNQKLKIQNITLNSKPKSTVKWVDLNLETYDNTNQLYTLALDLVLKKEGITNENS